MISVRSGQHARIVLAAGVALLACAHVRADAPSPIGDPIEGEVPPPNLDNAPNDMELEMLQPMYVAYPDTEYQPSMAPAEGTPVVDVAALSVPTATDCAEACIAVPECNAATWMGGNPEWTADGNCYLKTLGQTCAKPVFAEEIPNVYLLVAQIDGCPVVEGLPANTGMMAPAMAPTMMPMGAMPVGAMPTEAPMMAAPTPVAVGGAAPVAPESAMPAPAPIDGSDPVAPLPPTSTAAGPTGALAGESGTRSIAPSPDAGAAGLLGATCAVAGVVASALLL